jgi:hypothetical protein
MITSNYEENNGENYDDRYNRLKAANILDNYFGSDNCSISIMDRYSDFDLTVEYNNHTYYCDVKSCNYKSISNMKIGFNKFQYDKLVDNINAGKTDIRIIMLYSDVLAVYDVLSSNFEYDLFTRICNDKAKGNNHREFVRLNNNEPTAKILYSVIKPF